MCAFICLATKMISQRNCDCFLQCFVCHFCDQRTDLINNRSFRTVYRKKSTLAALLFVNQLNVPGLNLNFSKEGNSRSTLHTVHMLGSYCTADPSVNCLLSIGTGVARTGEVRYRIV
jgi:spore coat protein U-like protein